MKVSVPAGSTATVYVPATATQSFVAVGGAATPIGREDGYQVFAVDPGDVTFQQGTLDRRRCRRDRAGDALADARRAGDVRRVRPGRAIARTSRRRPPT